MQSMARVACGNQRPDGGGTRVARRQWHEHVGDLDALAPDVIDHRVLAVGG